MLGEETERFEVREIPLASMTLSEIEEFEDRAGICIDDVFDPGLPRGKSLRALAYLSRRRTDPEFTWEQAGELRVMTTAEERAADAVPAGPDPTSAPGS